VAGYPADILEGVPSFSVQYSFACPFCHHQNDLLETTVVAQNEVDAARTIFIQAKCPECGASIPSRHPFMTKIKEL
jgi:transcription elongation factor Elf1